MEGYLVEVSITCEVNGKTQITEERHWYARIPVTGDRIFLDCSPFAQEVTVVSLHPIEQRLLTQDSTAQVKVNVKYEDTYQGRKNQN